MALNFRFMSKSTRPRLFRFCLNEWAESIFNLYDVQDNLLVWPCLLVLSGKVIRICYVAIRSLRGYLHLFTDRNCCFIDGGDGNNFSSYMYVEVLIGHPIIHFLQGHACIG